MATLAAGLAADSATGCGANLVVMSVNVRLPSLNDKQNYWPNRRQLMGETLQNAAPDVIGLQEAYLKQILDIKAFLPRHEWFGEGRYGGHANEHMAILYNADRLSLLENGDFWLSDQPDVKASRTWGNNIPRMVTWGRFLVRQTGQQFYFFNTHFHHTGDADLIRKKSAELIEQRIRRLPPGVPVILTGDFNANDTSTAYQVLAGGWEPLMSDSRRVARSVSGPEGTFHGFRGKVTSHIDYILTRGLLQVLTQSHIDTHRGNLYPSDHLPVRAELRLCSVSD